MSIALIEATVIAHLEEKLLTSNVFAERPKTPPSEYYIVEKTAAGKANNVATATIAVQSYSATMLGAAQMSKAAEKAMETLNEVPDVGRVRLNSAYNFTDPDAREYRYQAIFDIYYMEGE